MLAFAALITGTHCSILRCTYLYGRKPKFKFCPLECDCTERISAKCNNRGLNHIPQNDRTSRITSLWLRNNTIRKLDDFSFMNWMNLRTLDLQKNNMSDVNAISVQALKPLKKLKVIGDILDIFNVWCFSTCIWRGTRLPKSTSICLINSKWLISATIKSTVSDQRPFAVVKSWSSSLSIQTRKLRLAPFLCDKYLKDWHIVASHAG